MLVLAKDNTATPAVYSSGDGSDPISVSLLLDGTGDPASITGSPATDLFVWADDDTGNIGSYSDVTASISGSDPGITWELSLDNATWAATIEVGTLDVSASYHTMQIYARASALNNGTVLTANYTTADVVVAATENPSA